MSGVRGPLGGHGGRPLKPRDFTTLQRDIQNVARIRMAMLLETQFDPDQAAEVIGACDALITKMQSLLRGIPDDPVVVLRPNRKKRAQQAGQ